MSNLGLQIILRTLRNNNIHCERSFIPDAVEEEELRRQKKPLFSLESERPLQEFDIIGFPISYEFEYLGVLKTLELANIPFESKNREWPLIVAGGAITAVNPEPIAPFIDLFIIGEGEEAIIELVESFEKYAHSGKKKLLENLAQKSGFYVPSLYKDSYTSNGEFEALTVLQNLPLSIERRKIRNLDLYEGHTEILTPYTEFSNIFLMEVARGCAYRCNFCMVSSSYGPYRIRHIEPVLQQINKGLTYTNKVGIMGATVGNYKYIKELSLEMSKRNVALSVSSLRADTMPGELIEAIAKGGQRSVTIAPEAGNERLRWAINKKMKDKDIYDTAAMISDAGLLQIKLYFMIGLPNEKEEDLSNIIEMVHNIRHIQKQHSKKATKAIVSVNPFIPKPFTYFERYPMAAQFTISKALKLLNLGFKKETGLTFTHEEPRDAILQSLLARGDRRLANVLVEISKIKKPTLGKWVNALESEGLKIEQFTTSELTRPILPWHHLAVTSQPVSVPANSLEPTVKQDFNKEESLCTCSTTKNLIPKVNERG